MPEPLDEIKRDGSLFAWRQRVWMLKYGGHSGQQLCTHATDEMTVVANRRAVIARRSVRYGALSHEEHSLTSREYLSASSGRTAIVPQFSDVSPSSSRSTVVQPRPRLPVWRTSLNGRGSLPHLAVRQECFVPGLGQAPR